MYKTAAKLVACLRITTKLRIGRADPGLIRRPHEAYFMVWISDA
jgi:hypothetical protein